MPKQTLVLDVAELARRQARQPSIGPVDSVPDRELVRSLISIGMPAHAAIALYVNGQLRFLALRVWADLQDYDTVPAARERINLLRERYAVMRKDDLVHDNPNRFL